MIIPNRLRERIEANFPLLISIKFENGYKVVRDNFLSYVEKENYIKYAIDCRIFLRCVKKNQHRVCFIEFTECVKFSKDALLFTDNMRLHESSVQSKCNATYAALTIKQLMLLNYHERIAKDIIVHNKKYRESSLPIHIGLSHYGRSIDK